MLEAPWLPRGSPSRRRRALHGHASAVGFSGQGGITVKYFFHTFGCRVNQYETQILREKLLQNGVSSAVEGFEEADVCVVNTCTVTQEADRDALKLVRRIARRNPVARLVVTGCLASRDPQAILKEAPAAMVIGNEGKETLPAMLGCNPAAGFSGVTGLHGRSRAFVKIQDGCNMSCTYCIIPSVRPQLSCKPIEALELEVMSLVGGGYAEIVLCGVRLGRYLVQDPSGRRVDFVAMLERLLAVPGDFRIRLSSFEITDVTERFLALMAASNGKLCPSLHLPLQSGSEAVLKRMRRWYSAAFYARRVEALKARLPRAGLFTDIMAGFPGESEAEHRESVDFVKKIGFSGLHVFRFSKRAGTPAARMAAQVSDGNIVSRAEELRALDRGFRSAFAARAVGSARRVLVEEGSPRREAVAEDFLSVILESDPGPGLREALVTRAEGPLAYARPAALRAQAAAGS